MYLVQSFSRKVKLGLIFGSTISSIVGYINGLIADQSLASSLVVQPLALSLIKDHLSFRHRHPVVVHLLLGELVVLSRNIFSVAFVSKIQFSPDTMPWQPSVA